MDLGIDAGQALVTVPWNALSFYWKGKLQVIVMETLEFAEAGLTKKSVRDKQQHDAYGNWLRALPPWGL